MRSNARQHLTLSEQPLAWNGSSRDATPLELIGMFDFFEGNMALCQVANRLSAFKPIEFAKCQSFRGCQGSFRWIFTCAAKTSLPNGNGNVCN